MPSLKIGQGALCMNPGWVCELVPWEAPEASIAQHCLKAAKASIVPAICTIQFLARLFVNCSSQIEGF
jgi:hypothetical protein